MSMSCIDLFEPLGDWSPFNSRDVHSCHGELFFSAWHCTIHKPEVCINRFAHSFTFTKYTRTCKYVHTSSNVVLFIELKTTAVPTVSSQEKEDLLSKGQWLTFFFFFHSQLITFESDSITFFIIIMIIRSQTFEKKKKNLVSDNKPHKGNLVMVSLLKLFDICTEVRCEITILPLQSLICSSSHNQPISPSANWLCILVAHSITYTPTNTNTPTNTQILTWLMHLWDVPC